MYKVHLQAGAIKSYRMVCAYVQKFMDYLPLHTHKPCNNLHIAHCENLLEVRCRDVKLIEQKA